MQPVSDGSSHIISAVKSQAQLVGHDIAECRKYVLSLDYPEQRFQSPDMYYCGMVLPGGDWMSVCIDGSLELRT